MVLPAPGEPLKRILWCPAAAIISALFAWSCPLISSSKGPTEGLFVFWTKNAAGILSSPFRAKNRTRSVDMPITPTPSMREACSSFCIGTNTLLSPASFAASTIGMIPLTGRMVPSRASSLQQKQRINIFLAELPACNKYGQRNGNIVVSSVFSEFCRR